MLENDWEMTDGLGHINTFILTHIFFVATAPTGAPSHFLALTVTDRIFSGHNTATDHYSLDNRCIYNFITPTHFRYTYASLSSCLYWCTQQTLFYTVGASGYVEGQYTILLPTLFFNMSTCGRFPLIPLCFFARSHLTKNNQGQQLQKKKNTTIVMHLRRQPFYHATITHFEFLSKLYSLFFPNVVGYSACIYQNYNTITYLI